MKLVVGDSQRSLSYPVMDAGTFMRQIGNFGIDLSHLPGKPNEIIYPHLGPYSGDFYILLIGKDVKKILKDHNSLSSVNKLDFQLQILDGFTDESIAFNIKFRKLIFIHAYPILHGYDGPQDDAMYMVHLKDDRVLFERNIINKGYNLPLASTGDVADIYSEINTTPNPDELWNWGEIFGEILNEEASGSIPADRWTEVSTFAGFPTVEPTGLEYFGVSMADAFADLTRKAGVLMTRTPHGQYELKDPFWVNPILNAALTIWEPWYMDGKGPIHGYTSPNRFRFLFPKFDPLGSDKLPFHEIVHDFAPNSPNGGEMCIMGGMSALMNNTSTPENLADLDTYVLEVAGNVKGIHEAPLKQDIVFSTLFFDSLDSRYHKLHVYDHGHGLFSRLITKKTDYPIIKRPGLGGGTGATLVRFVLDAALTTAQASKAASIEDTTSSRDTQAITVYNPETSAAGTYMFEGDVGDAGLCSLREDGNWWIVQLECP